MKTNNSICGPGDAIRYAVADSSQVDYEAELAVVIGRQARRVSEADALSYVFGYTCCNDVSARDAQFGDKQWVRGKSFDTFCPLGPCIVTADEIPDPQALAHHVPRQRRDAAGRQHRRHDLRRRRNSSATARGS